MGASQNTQQVNDFSRACPARPSWAGRGAAIARILRAVLVTLSELDRASRQSPPWLPQLWQPCPPFSCDVQSGDKFHHQREMAVDLES